MRLKQSQGVKSIFGCGVGFNQGVSLCRYFHLSEVGKW